jgi:beta-glucosidase/6-phospho-beta-glucosidase/beta-galactosidase
MTENGCAVAEEDEDEALKDIERAVYLKRYLTEVRGVESAAVESGVVAACL